MEDSSAHGPLRLTVLGTGYLGITHATCMSSLGFEVLGVDIDAGKVDQLTPGNSPFTSRDSGNSSGPSWAPGRLASRSPTRAPPSSATCTSSARAPRRSPAVTTLTYPR